MSTRTISKSIDLKNQVSKDFVDNNSQAAVNKYITQIDNGGIKVHPYTSEGVDTKNYLKIDSNNISFYQDVDSISTEVASFGTDGMVLGQEQKPHLEIKSNGINIKQNDISLVRFGSTSRIGREDNYRIEFDEDQFSLINQSDVVVFGARASGVTQARRATRSCTFTTMQSGSSKSFPLPSAQTLVVGSTITLSGEYGNMATVNELTFIAGTAATKSATTTMSGGFVVTLGSIAYDGAQTFTVTNASGATGSWHLSVQYDVLGYTDMGQVTVTGALYDNNLAGAIQMYGGQITQSVSNGIITTTAPAGWLLCDGSEVSRTVYDRLFAVIGTSYGAGDGSNTFNLPDFRGKFPLGVSTSHPLTGTGSSGGSENATLVSHSHGPGSLAMDEKGAHAHRIRLNDVGASGSARNIPVSTASLSNNTFTDTVGGHKHTISGSTETKGSSAAGANMPPYRTINFIIATGKTS